MLKVGLTGGMGSGKSTVANLFQRLGISIIDADQVAKDLVAPGQPGLDEIRRVFGPVYILDNGELNRQLLRQLVFDSPAARSRLEGILHPLVYREISHQIEELSGSYCILEIPLIIETSKQSFVDRLLVVDCPESLQVERIHARTGHDDETITKILKCQASREERLRWADDVIVNTEDIATLDTRVRELDHRYRKLAQSRRNVNSN